MADRDFSNSGRVQVCLWWFFQPMAEDRENYPVSPHGLLSLAVHPCTTTNPHRREFEPIHLLAGARWKMGQTNNHVLSNFTLAWNILLQSLTVYTVDLGRARRSYRSWWVRDWGSLHGRVLVLAVT